MPLTFTLSKAVITRIEINPIPQTITVDYTLTDAEERFYMDNQIVYVRQLPLGEDGLPVPNLDKHFVVLTTTQYNYVVALYTAIANEVNSRLV